MSKGNPHPDSLKGNKNLPQFIISFIFSNLINRQSRKISKNIQENVEFSHLGSPVLRKYMTFKTKYDLTHHIF
jgi:hypothetical protein